MCEREACPGCPFKEDAKLGYDADAMEALDADYEPSCHAKVGVDNVFAEMLPSDETICIGYEMWLANKPGYAKPKLAETINEQR